MTTSEKKQDFFERPENIKKLWISLYMICGLMALLDFLLPSEVHSDLDGFFGFYPLLGFISCAVLILLSKIAGFLLKVPENYYE